MPGPDEQPPSQPLPDWMKEIFTPTTPYDPMKEFERIWRETEKKEKEKAPA